MVTTSLFFRARRGGKKSWEWISCHHFQEFFSAKLRVLFSGWEYSIQLWIGYSQSLNKITAIVTMFDVKWKNWDVEWRKKSDKIVCYVSFNFDKYLSWRMKGKKERTIWCLRLLRGAVLNRTVLWISYLLFLIILALKIFESLIDLKLTLSAVEQMLFHSKIGWQVSFLLW